MYMRGTEVILKPDALKSLNGMYESVGAPVRADIAQNRAIQRPIKTTEIRQVRPLKVDNKRVETALKNAGITTHDQIDKMSDDELLAIKGIGKATLKELR